MKALLKEKGKATWVMQDIAEPFLLPHENEVIIKVHSVGICGSDLNRIRLNVEDHETIVLGHEFGGIVIQSNRPELLNNKVVVNPIISCGYCDNCMQHKTQFCSNPILMGKNRSGAFTEKVKVPEKSVYTVPDNFDMELCCLVDGMAVINNMLSKLSMEQKNINVLIIGDGTVAACCIAGISLKYPHSTISIMGKHPANLEQLKEIATHHYQDFNEHSSYDLIIETVGRCQNDTFNMAVSHIAIGGVIAILGVYDPEFILNFNARHLFYREAQILGVNSFVIHDQRDDFMAALTIISNHQPLFRKIISKRFAFSSFTQALEASITKSNGCSLKTLVTL
ncbi:MAG: zinc-dependent alcohol dehydrogenase [Alphaproteobacteria bacterium]